MRVKFVAIPIGHTGTTLTRALDHLTAAFSTLRPRDNQANANRGTSRTITYSNDRSHENRLFKSMLNALAYLAQSHLLGTIRNTNSLVDALPGGAGHNRAHSAATLTHTHTHTQPYNRGQPSPRKGPAPRVPRRAPPSHEMAVPPDGRTFAPQSHHLRDPAT